MDELDYSGFLSPEIIRRLAILANETLQSQEWKEIFEKLSPENYRRIMDEKIKIQQRSREDLTAMPVNHKESPSKFYGNMGQPENTFELEQRKKAIKRFEEE